MAANASSAFIAILDISAASLHRPTLTYVCAAMCARCGETPALRASWDASESAAVSPSAAVRNEFIRGSGPPSFFPIPPFWPR